MQNHQAQNHQTQNHRTQNHRVQNYQIQCMKQCQQILAQNLQGLKAIQYLFLSWCQFLQGFQKNFQNPDSQPEQLKQAADI